MKVMIPTKLSTTGKIDLARAALANDIVTLSKLIAAIPGNEDAAGTTKYFATRFLRVGLKTATILCLFAIFCGGGKSKASFLRFQQLARL